MDCSADLRERNLKSTERGLWVASRSQVIDHKVKNSGSRNVVHCTQSIAIDLLLLDKVLVFGALQT